MVGRQVVVLRRVAAVATVVVVALAFTAAPASAQVAGGWRGGGLEGGGGWSPSEPASELASAPLPACAGCYNPIADFGNDTMLSEALNATAGELGSYLEGVGAQNVTSDRICNASQQVVAGLNFRVTFSPDCADPDAPRLNLTIFRDLQGGYSLTDVNNSGVGLGP